MSGYIQREDRLFDPATGQLVGYVDLRGGEQIGYPVSTAGNSGRPAPPTAVLAIAGEASAIVSFVGDGQAASYTVTATPGGASATGSSSPIAVAGLANGTAYTFSVSAANSAGQSNASGASNAVTPRSRPAGLSGIPGLMCWYDASQEAVVADGTAVASLTDWSGNGYTAAQATVAQRPTYAVAASWGGGTTGKPAIKFNGNQQNIISALTSAVIGRAATIFVVFSQSSLSATSGATDCRVMSNEVTRYDSGWYIGTSDAGLGGGGNPRLKVYGNNSSSVVSATALAINAVSIASVVTERQPFLNGARATTFNNNGGIGPELVKRQQAIALGSIAAGNGGQSLQGSIAEVLIFRGTLTDSQRQSVESYLATKYNQSAPATAATVN